MNDLTPPDIKKLKNIIKAFLNVHIKPVEEALFDDTAALFNFTQHLFSFQNEMDAQIKHTGLTQDQVFNRNKDYQED